MIWKSTTAAALLVLTGEGSAFSAGMDLKDFFRATDKKSDIERHSAYRETRNWQWRKLMFYGKPTIAMVNGWCFGGAFTPLICCDLSIAAEEAIFGLSEINWGIIPGGVVPKALSTLVNDRKALYYIMTGEQFGGQAAVDMGLVNEAVPLAQLEERTRKLAKMLLEKNPTVLRAAKLSYKYIREMTWEESAEYLTAKLDQTQAGRSREGPRAWHGTLPRHENLQARSWELSTLSSGVKPHAATRIVRKKAMVDAEHRQANAPRSAVARLLNPRSVAIAGISSKPGALAAIVLDNLERFGFSGDIHLVHPTAT